ncbi:(2Fe-2S) ferredoxin domain-containing protein [candidate division WOR-3 bacterium]|jgi:NADP-reducing hydrogenase subunit HndB|nr:(2Fe-2S) ferredoxin domain-containing protein [candidate division WOR-3 bacterium]
MNLEDLRKIREKVQNEMCQRVENAKIKITVEMGTSGIAAGAREVLKTFTDEINKKDISNVIVTQTGEKGYSSKEPIVEIYEKGKEIVIYGNMDSDKAKRVVDDHIEKGNIVKEFEIKFKK